MTVHNTTHAEVYRSGLTRRYRWRLVHRNGHIIARSAQGRGYSRRVDAVQALATATGTRAMPGDARLVGLTHDGQPRHITIVDA